MSTRNRNTQKPPRYRVILDKREGEWDIQFGTTSKADISDLELCRVQEMLEGLETAVRRVRQVMFHIIKDAHGRKCNGTE